MSDGPEPAVDPELASIRARRIAEMRARASPPPPPAESVAPEPLTESTFVPFVSANPRVVVDVWAPWCGPCRVLSPIVESLARELRGRVRFAKVNADDEPGVAGRFGVQAIPTLLVFEAGRLVDRILGALPEATLRQRLLATFRLSSGTG